MQKNRRNRNELYARWCQELGIVQYSQTAIGRDENTQRHVKRKSCYHNMFYSRVRPMGIVSTTMLNIDSAFVCER
jgi:hypothetical protein